MIRTRRAGSLVAVLLAACGGGGGNSPANDATAVAGVSQTDPSASAPAPAPVPLPENSTTRSALVAALRTGFGWAITSDTADLMTLTQGAANPSLVTHSSRLQTLDGGGFSGARIELAATLGLDTLTFDGTGRMVLDGFDPPPRYAEVSLAGPQVSIPGTATFPTTLGEWQVVGTSHFVRLIVGGIDGLPNWMRVCWQIQHPLALRLSCSRHLRETGALVGADTIHDIGRTLEHRSNEESPNPRRLLPCTETRTSPPSAPTTRLTYYRAFSFDDPYLVTNGTRRTRIAADSESSNTIYTVEQLASGATRYTATAPSVGWYATSADVRNNAVERAFDVSSDGNGTVSIECR